MKKKTNFTVLSFLKIFFLIMLVLPLYSNYSFGASVAVTDSMCGNTPNNRLNSNTYYYLTEDIEDNYVNCLEINGNNVTLDCQGFEIGSGSNGDYAIVDRIATDNVTIRDCVIDYGYIIDLDNGATNYYIEDLDINAAGTYGIALDNVENLTFVNSAIDGIGNNDAEDAIYIGSNSLNLHFENISMRNDGGGRQIEISSSNGISFINVDIVPTSNIDNGAIYITNSDNLLFTEMTVQNIGNGNPDYGVYISGSDNITFINSSFNGIDEAEVFYVTSSSNITLENVDTNDNGDGDGEYALELLNIDGLYFEGLTVSNSNEDGAVYMSGIDNAFLSGIIINGATIGDETNEYPIELRSSTNVTINGSYIYNANDETGLYVTGLTDFTLSHSHINNNGAAGDYGIELFSTNGAHFYNITFTNIPDTPIYLSSVTDITIDRLRADNAIQYTIEEVGSTNNITVLNSRITNTPEPIYFVSTPTLSFYNVTLDTCTTQCFYVTTSDGMNITDLTTITSSADGVYIGTSSDVYIDGINSTGSGDNGVEITGTSDDNLTMYNIVSYSNSGTGLHITGLDNSRGDNITLFSNTEDGLFTTSHDNSNWSNVFAYSNTQSGAQFDNSDDITLILSDLRPNTGFNLELSSNSNDFSAYANYIGQNVSNDNWGLTSLWNTSVAGGGLGNFWNEFTCVGDVTESRVFMGRTFGVCISDTFNVNLVNSRIDYAPLTIPSFLANLSFVSPTPSDGANLCVNNITINVTPVGSSSVGISTHIDFNTTLLLWLNTRYANTTHIIDNSTYSNNAEMINSPTIEDTIANRGNYTTFSGLNQYLNISSFNGVITEGATLEAWIYPNSFNCDISQDCTIISGDNSNFKLGIENNQTLDFCVDTGDCTSINKTNLRVDGWQHVAGVWNSTHCNLYVNGTLINSSTCNSVSSPNTVLIGQSILGSRTFNGSIDEVKIWKRALSSREINASYDVEITNLVQTFDLNESGDYTYKACSSNYFGNLTCTDLRTISVVSSANVMVISPINGEVYLQEINNVNAHIFSSLNLSNVTYYLNGNLSNNGTINYVPGSMFNFSVLLSTLRLGNNNITFNYSDYCGENQIFGGHFNYMRPTQLNTVKNITRLGPNDYNIKMDVRNIRGIPTPENQIVVAYVFMKNTFNLTSNFSVPTSTWYNTFNTSETLLGLEYNGTIHQFALTPTNTDNSSLSAYQGVYNNSNSWYLEFNVTGIEEFQYADLFITGLDPIHYTKEDGSRYVRPVDDVFYFDHDQTLVSILIAVASMLTIFWIVV